ncbi:MAG: crotonase/enoyl-CoA hydratase family protein [Notoacmeibacter sp.]|nr:crotonase/enoyl-CoA hydratase family protein [Notoacmeibacter sp.]MCC0033000.1 crotonase/enoyl-CoA hydratase family protein [Brucellaceae bacterium]
MSEWIEVARDGAVMTIRMNRPDKKNAITRAMYAAMAAALTESDADDAIRARVILGVPGAFSSGNDLADFMVIATGGEGGMEVYDFLMALATAKKPIVSAADGIAVGIGTTIHLHCDLTFATERTNFVTPFVNLGLVPEAGSSLIAPEVIGRQAAFAMLALGRPIPAADAKAMGLIHALVSEDGLEAAAMQAAHEIASKPPEALRIARDLMRGDRQPLIDRIQAEGKLFRERLKSDEARNAFIAFMNKKKG